MRLQISRKKNRFLDDFRGNITSLIRLNSRNISRKTWRRSLKVMNLSLTHLFSFPVEGSRSSHRKYSIKKVVLKNFAKFTENHLWQSLFFNKVAGLRPATLLKTRLWLTCFPANFENFLRKFWELFGRTPLEDCFLGLNWGYQDIFITAYTLIKVVCKLILCPLGFGWVSNPFLKRLYFW